MSNRFIKYYAICLTGVIAIGGVILYILLPDPIKTVTIKQDPRLWVAPNISTLTNSAESNLILYGRELIINTAAYLGPKGTVTRMSNGMNCGNCHLDGGTRSNGNSFAAVAANYPKFRNRSGQVESVEFRINDCFIRSMNGNMLDSTGREMQAMVAYLKWLGKDVQKNINPRGSGVTKINILDRAASPGNGQIVFVNKCVKCHKVNGEGEFNHDATGYTYPPLWGKHSYNIGAGLYRIASLAGYVKYNMPYTTIQQPPQLTDEEAWDVAAYISSQKRPVKYFKEDWPDISKKPVDYPFGPYVDSFSEDQHKYGPFAPLKKESSIPKF